MNRKRIKFEKIFLVIMLVIICFNVFPQTVFGEINKTYGDNTAVVTNNLDDAVDDEDSFLSMITGLIYIVASGAEWLIQQLFTMTTGMKTFPWADRVIFNAVPFLDINFINPSNNSLFVIGNNSTAIAQIVSNTYYTLFVIATAFFSICVGVMALRLIFASIADEKAKYKQSIMKVIMAMILLFLSHYIISFIFFVNEKMVEVAYSILLDATNEMQLDVENTEYLNKRTTYLWMNKDGNSGGLLNSQNVSYDKYNAYNEESNEYNEIKEFYAFEKNMLSNEENSETLADVLKNDKYYKYVVALLTGEFKNGDTTIKLDDWEKYRDSELGAIYDNSVKRLASNLFDNGFGIKLLNFLSDIEFLANLEDEDDEVLDKLKAYTEYEEWTNKEEWEEAFEDDKGYFTKSRELSENEYKDKTWCRGRIHYSEFYVEYLIENGVRGYDDNVKSQLLESMTSDNLANFLYKTYESLKDIKYADKVDSTINNKQALSSIGELFKKNAYNPKNKENKYNIIACILYAMFIVQSVMYFTAYTKRFFYVLILALFAPLVIIFDFLINATK